MISEFIKVGKMLNEIVQVKDSTGKIIHEFMRPVAFEFALKDALQVIVGATILAIPVGFTEEVWILGETLPWPNISALIFVSMVFISLFVYYNYYRSSLKRNIVNFLKRSMFTYLISLAVVALLMTIIDQVDWVNLLDTSLKKVFIVAFPASMSAVVADTVK